MITQKFETWKKEGQQKYGTDSLQWKIKCPACGHVQTPNDFVTLSLEKDLALTTCLGRHKKGVGCDWAAGGLLKTLGKGRLILSQGVVSEIFDFEDNSNAIVEDIEVKTHPGLNIKSWKDYQWDEYVPQEIRDSIMKFWSEDFGSRSPDAWAKNALENKAPQHGEVVTLRELCSDNKLVTGKFIHAWSNIGRIIDDQGKIRCVSF